MIDDDMKAVMEDSAHRAIDALWPDFQAALRKLPDRSPEFFARLERRVVASGVRPEQVARLLACLKERMECADA